MNNIDSRIALTDDQIEAAFDKLGFGVYADDLAVTTESITDFLEARKGWAKPGIVERNADGELVIVDAQSAAGRPRGSVVVVDFGDVRAVYRS